MELDHQTDVLNLLAASINPDRNRLKCHILAFHLDFFSQEFFKVITVETKKMHGSDRLSEKQAKPVNEAQMLPGVKKKRSDRRIRNIATFDNGTMVEAFKFLSYCQLAKNSLASKKFRDLIRTHRHKLALLYVDSLVMFPFPSPHRKNVSNFDPIRSLIEIFGQKLSTKEYNEWVVRNGYSKQIPIEDQVAGEQCAQYGTEEYMLRATALYKDPNCCQPSASTTVFHALIKLNHKHWPLFQHLVRLLTDPFVYINFMRLTPQKDFVNLLAGAINSDRSRLQCKRLKFSLDGNVPKFINWAKNNTFCDEILIEDVALNHDEELLDLLVTGAQCTSVINTGYYDSSKVIVDFVQKFLDIKSSDEYQAVESIQGKIEGREVIEVLKRNHTKFVVKEERDEEDDH
ncbi:hypothetical protein DdX_20878 [Ditylenchus destructor]|uniref:Uncharacterized protein n=1 Tax=Ditylenchus destructor TaxID=166010 RepID=A0AAD4MGJ0_9BILA|nr:hypothetical protein DdX_20878 [Ditylenchus destructor]